MSPVRSEADILRAFEGLDKAPGSKKARREPTELAAKRKQKTLVELESWENNPIVRSFNGKEVELFTIQALGLALGKEIVTIRLWERKGYIPIAPYRLRSKNLNGQKVKGNRVYPREIIEITVEEFSRRGLLGSARVEWNQHHDLTATLLERWKDVTNRITN